MTANALRDVLQSKLPSGSAAGPSGGTFEQLQSALLTDENAFSGGLWFINAQLAGRVLHCESLLASRLIPIAKQSAQEPLAMPADAVPRVRPIAIGEV